MQFKVDLRLTSEVDTDDHPCSWHDEEETCFACPDEDGEDQCAYDSYCATDGSAVYLKTGQDLSSTPFSSTELNDYLELKCSQDHFILVSTDQVEIKFQLRAWVEVAIDAASEESAKEQCQAMIPELFEIHNRAVSEANEDSVGLAIESVEIVSITAI